MGAMPGFDPGVLSNRGSKIMKITKIRIRNFLGIENFQPDGLGKLNRIEGGNGVGKSSVVKAIQEAIKSSGTDPSLIRLGEDRAEIMIEIDDSIEVARTITRTANTVKVVSDGTPVNKPQAFLKSLIGPYNFNPVEFFLAKPRERRELLLSSIPFTIQPDDITGIVGEDCEVDLDKFDYTKHGLSVLEDIRRTVYERRTEENRELIRLTKAVEQDKRDIPQIFNKDEYADFDLEAKVSELSAAKVAIEGHERDKAQIETMRQRSIEIGNDIDRLKAEIVRQESEKARLVEEGKALVQKVESFEPPDVASMDRLIGGYKEAQRLTNKLEDIERKEQGVAESKARHEALDSFYKLLGGDVPRGLLAKMQLPVDGLEIKGDTITVKGVDVDKLSTSEQIKFATRIARSLAGELKIVCIDRFESLDKPAREAFEAECAGDEFEYFVTVVTGGELRMDAVAEAGT
jgi:hypothetical protein